MAAYISSVLVGVCGCVCVCVSQRSGVDHFNKV